MGSENRNNIRKLRDEKGLSQEALAAKIAVAIDDDVTGATISRLESGRMQLTLDWMVRIATALEVTPYDLIIPDGGAAVRFVPVIGQVSAGNWQEAVGDPLSVIPIPADIASAKAFALKPLGDSMDRIVTEDGYAVVDPEKKELIPGKVYAFRNEHGETTFKRYAESPPRLEPCSTNPEHQPILLGSEPLIVIGRVVLAVQPVE